MSERIFKQVEGGSQVGLIARPPQACQVCGGRIGNVAIDGKVRGARWAWMCFRCHQAYGIGLGIGKGQKYRAE